MQQTNQSLEVKGLITLYSIMIALLFSYITYDCFFSKSPIEIEVKNRVYEEIKQEKFNDTNWIATDRELHTIIEVKNAKPFERFICNTETASPYNALILIIYLGMFLFILFKIKDKGLYNVEISKHIVWISILVLLTYILIMIQDIILRNFINRNTNNLISTYKPLDYIYFVLIFSLLSWLSRFYKKAFELKQEQDLTI